MGIANPIAVYNAENNIEAQLLCDYLERNGIEAYATYDESVIGLWAFGRLPEIHKPQLWIDKSDVEAAAVLLAEYERGRFERLAKDKSSDSTVAIDIVCEECGKTTPFPASKRGTVQDCGHCGAFVDVEDTIGGDWDVGEPAEGDS